MFYYQEGIYYVLQVIISISMLKNSKPSANLSLQSYKIDNSHLQTKINELQQLKSELRSTISRSREDHSILLNQIHQLKHQNEILKNEIIKLQFTKKAQNTLIQQLQKKLEQSQTHLYDAQLKLKQQQSKRVQVLKELEVKMRQLQAEKEKIVQNYEQQLFKISKVTQVNDGFDIKRVINQIYPISRSSSSKSLPRQSIKVKKIKKASAQVIPVIQSNQKLLSNNCLKEDQNPEDIYLEMIRKVYKQLCKIQIKSKDIMNIPIIGSFSQLRTPTSNDVQRFFSNYPFSITGKENIILIYEFLVKQLERKGIHSSGKEIVKEITSSLEEIQGEKEVSYVSANSSVTYLNESSMQVSFKNDGIRRISKPQVTTAFEYIGGRSKGPIQQQQQMQSGESMLI